MICLPKACGGDVELGNFVLGMNRTDGSGGYAARALLRQFDGISASTLSGGGLGGGGTYSNWWSGATWVAPAPAYNPQDVGRKFLPVNGGCVYEDLSHLELCLPEVVSAFDWVACWGAMLGLTEDALGLANEVQSPGHVIKVLVNNSDGLGQSYGGHLDMLVTRQAWENLINRKLHYLAYLAAFQVSSVVFTGQGKVGSENGAPSVGFQLTQRGDFFETVLGTQTTFRRPLVNARNEPLCGLSRDGERSPGGSLAVDGARLHVIFFDSTLCQVATLLRVGTMQIILTMLEAGRVDGSLALDDPLDALTRWGHDPTLSARARLVSGDEFTAVELQHRFLEQAAAFVEDGGCDGLVPRASEILALWAETLGMLRDRDLPGLVGRLDWVTKQALLREAIGDSPHLSWDSADIKYLDHLYSSLPDGLFCDLDRDGLVERVVSDGDIERFMHSAPEDTRAWGRSLLLRLGGDDAIRGVDWDVVRFRGDRGVAYTEQKKIEMANPLGWTREALSQATEDFDLADLLERYGEPERHRGVTTTWEQS